MEARIQRTLKLERVTNLFTIAEYLVITLTTSINYLPPSLLYMVECVRKPDNT